MEEYLEHWVGIQDDDQINNILEAGFNDTHYIAKQDPSYAHDVCQLVRKNGEGGAPGRNVSVATEKTLTNLILLQRLNYMC